MSHFESLPSGTRLVLFQRSQLFVGNAACPVPAKPFFRNEHGDYPVPFSGVLIMNFLEGVEPLPYLMITIITWERAPRDPMKPSFRRERGSSRSCEAIFL